MLHFSRCCFLVALKPSLTAMPSTETKYYQHRFENVEDYLHHRSPYLLVDAIESIDERSIQASSLVKEDAFYIQGHFPGAPILPGAMMLELSTQTAGILIAANFNPMQVYNTHDPHFNEYALGVLVKVKHARYRGFARPGETLAVDVRLEEKVGEVFDFGCTIRVGERKIMQNRFQLTNMLSSTLRG
jgi:3-hydroxyacyl-[acyl-carrier-protein] dehydratase